MGKIVVKIGGVASDNLTTNFLSKLTNGISMDTKSSSFMAEVTILLK